MFDFLTLAVWGKISLTSLIICILGIALIQAVDNPFEKANCGWGSIIFGLTLLAMVIFGGAGCLTGLVGVIWCL
jgi:hypothetical protein